MKWRWSLKEDWNRAGGWRDFLTGLVKGAGFSVLVAWLFYRDVRGLLVLPVCLFFVCRKEIRTGEERRRAKTQQQFAELLGFLEEALAAGYSLEHAVGEAEKRMRSDGEEDYFDQLLLRMQRKMSLGGTVEEAFSEFAEAADCEEARDFAEVLTIAKRTGGAVRQVVCNTEGLLRRKEETLRQIRGSLHSSLYENNLMKTMPFAMLLYLQLGMPGFLSVLYHNAFGVAVMTVLLLCYLGLCAAIDFISKVTV